LSLPFYVSHSFIARSVFPEIKWLFSKKLRPDITS